ncbi:MAG: calmodulin [Bradymonadia bacterium]|jgi:calmodulin
MADQAEVREIFDHFDSDGNGVVDAAEFTRLCRALDPEFDQAEIAVGLSIVDHNGNGQIEFEEFVSWWQTRT